MMDPFTTQRGARPAVVSQLIAAGFDDAEEIGRGGFGVVYRCVQTTLERTVAVKVLTDVSDENRERFLREQRAMGQLTGHPNIVGVLQVGETDCGYPYLVMQYHQRGSLDARIRRLGPLPLHEVLRLGVKMAGALEAAHRLEILHRDVKPANILLTDYGEPALTDFGIARVSGGFKTEAGTILASPAFTAPEILCGDPPTQASDVYGLGATLFCALTGHAAFERRNGEQVVAQFLRISSESAPDLRENGIPDDVSAVVDKAMSRDPDDRPSTVELCQSIQQAQASNGVPVDEMAPHIDSEADGPVSRAGTAVAGRRATGNLPQDLTSFIGRRTELGEVKRLLSSSRLVTLTGFGGVGKTRLALRAATEALEQFPDGGWLVELGELRDGSLLVDVVAAGVGLRDQSATPLRDVLIEFLSTRRLLLVLDNCEQVVDAVAKLSETLLRACPQVRILATSREALAIGGESVLRLSPLAVPEADQDPTIGGMPGYDAVALFAERAVAAVPGFELTENNKATVAKICSRLDGLPLAIELAAARLRAMSPEQILERLVDRYALLTRGSRGAPPRQQTLGWSVGWSYDLCTAAEQRLWRRLSVFAGTFGLDAAEHIWADGPYSDDAIDLLSSLVDKSILIRTEDSGVVRFRLLDILRDYGDDQLRQTGGSSELRRRHRGWYQRMIDEAQKGWFSSEEVIWIERLARDLPNIREALEFSLREDDAAGLSIAATLLPFWISRGMLTEGRRWLDRTLRRAPREPTAIRVKALCAAAMLAALQEDLAAAAASAAEGRALIGQVADPEARAAIDLAEGFAAILGGDVDRGRDCLKDALDASGDLTMRASALLLLGWAYQLRHDYGSALVWYEKALTLSESRGESVYRGYALLSIGVASWRQGDHVAAELRLKQSLGLARSVNDPRGAATCLEALAWVAGEAGSPREAAVLMGAADRWSRAVGSPALAIPFPNLVVYHEDCEHRAREVLGDKAFEEAHQKGGAFDFTEAIAYALGG